MSRAESRGLLMSSKRCKMAERFDVDVEKLGIDAHIGDIVGGRDYLTGMYCARPIENVICCVMSGKMSKEYELEGENDNGDS